MIVAEVGGTYDWMVIEINGTLRKKDLKNITVTSNTFKTSSVAT